MEEIINEIIEKNEEEMLNSLASLIKIPSVYSEAKEGAPYGENAKAALLEMERIARNLGFETIETVDDKVVFIEYGSGDRLIGVFGHLDVVPAGNGWTYPPFGAEVHAGRMYGRGVVDNEVLFLPLYASMLGEAEPARDNQIVFELLRVKRGEWTYGALCAKCRPRCGITDGLLPMSLYRARYQIITICHCPLNLRTMTQLVVALRRWGHFEYGTRKCKSFIKN